MAVPDDLIRRITAEAMGTFILVLVGTGAGLTFGNSSYAFGFALIGIMYAIGHISGAHVNPAVTVGLAAVGRFPMAHVPWYIGAQVGGALLASLFLRLVYGNVGGLGAPVVADGFSLLDGFLLELIATAVFVFIFMAIATERRVPEAAIGLGIGGALLAITILAGPVTGAAVNPARALAPALASWTFSDLWIYLTAPFIGAVIGAVGYEFIRVPEGWAGARPGLEPVPQSEPRRARPAQQRRSAAPADAEPAARSTQQRRPAQRPAHDPDTVSTALYDEDELPPVRSAQRPPSQPRSQADPNAARRPAQQRRRPPEQ